MPPYPAKPDGQSNPQCLQRFCAIASVKMSVNAAKRAGHSAAGGPLCAPRHACHGQLPRPHAICARSWRTDDVRLLIGDSAVASRTTNWVPYHFAKKTLASMSCALIIKHPSSTHHSHRHQSLFVLVSQCLKSNRFAVCRWLGRSRNDRLGQHGCIVDLIGSNV